MRRGAFTVAAIAVLLTVTFAPAPAATSKAEPQVTDPQGDAREWDTVAVWDRAKGACLAMWVSCAVKDAALAAAGDPAAPRAGGVPAAPSLDGLAAEVRETPDQLIVELTVASLDPSFAGVVSDDGRKSARYEVSLGVPAAPTAGVALTVTRWNGVLETLGWYRIQEPDCIVPRTCEWRVVYEVEFGTPGKIRWTVPRSLVPAGAAEQTEPDHFHFHIVRIEYQAEGFALYAVDPDWTIAGSLEPMAAYEVDGSAEGSPFTFEFEPGAAPPTPAWNGTLLDPEADILGEDPPTDIDIRSLTFEETPATLVIEFEVADVAARPALRGYFVTLALRNGWLVDAGLLYDRDGPVQMSSAVQCSFDQDPETGERTKTCGEWTSVPFEALSLPGAPGRIHFQFPRAALGAPPAGTAIEALYGLTLAFEGDSLAPGSADPPAFVLVTGIDAVAPVPPHVLMSDTEVPSGDGDGGVLLDDSANDVRMPTPDPTGEAASGRFDITSVEVKPRASDSFRVTIGVRDLSRVEVPVGYDALAYAVGIETPEGRFMTGYYENTGDTQQFFCAEDVTVFPPLDEKRDPGAVIRTTIQGVVSTTGRSGGAPGGGAGGEGAITVFVPYECLGMEAPGTVSILRVSAGAYLVQSAAGQRPRVHAPDELDPADVGVDIVPASVAAPPAVPWYAEPLGLENFWDIAGIVAALAFSAGGLVLVQRRRRALQQYLREIDVIVSSHKTDAKTREGAFVALRARLKEDLVRGRLTESHFVLVERRIDEHLSRTRIEELSKGFRDLPYDVVTRLQELLADGRLSENERHLFGLLLDDCGVKGRKKQDILQKLETWVRADA